MTFQAGVVEVVGARETRKIAKDTIEITIRGRPITLNIPLQYQADYDITKEVRPSHIMMLLTPALLCHKNTAQGMQNAHEMGGILCLLLVLYGIRIGGFQERKGI